MPSLPLIHVTCAAPCRYLGDPDYPPDPDHHGNHRFTYECRACGERGTVTQPQRASALLPDGFEFSDGIEWAIPL